jgi:hypothetical protein
LTFDPKTFDWWKAALAAKETGGAYPPIYNDVAMTGTYAFKPSKNEAPKAVFFYYHSKTGDLLCRVDNQSVKYGLDLWPRCARHPIPRAVHDAVVGGGKWPHEITVQFADGRTDSTLTSNAGHNSGDADADLNVYKGDIAEWSDRIKKAIKKGVPTNQTEADALADLATKLEELIADAAKARATRTDPLYRAFKDESEKWNSFIKPAEPYASNARSLVRSFVKQEQKRREAEAAQAAAEAAERAAAAQEPGAKVESVESLLPPKIEVAPARAGTRGKTIGTTTRAMRQDVVFEDFAKAAAFFCQMEKVPPAIFEAVMKMTFQMLKAGVAVPGAKLEKAE